MQIRTRYAPSPTGFLHIGGARTALFNYLFAKNNNGQFILRIEDTDQARNVENGEKSQVENLAWLGINPDEMPGKGSYGPYRQSEKLARYQEIVKTLIDKGFAYYAYDNEEELAQQKKEQLDKGIFSFRYDRNWLKIDENEEKQRHLNKKYVIRLAMPKDYIYSWNDLVRGKIEFNSDSISDWVLVKSDGFPTYNFAVVVDDFDMKITHIFRGEEHISNTPKQLALYEMLEWPKPEFGHLTIITDQSGKKLSKRDSSLFQFIEDYKNEGFHPDAIFNFLSLLGWTSGTEEEFFSHKKLIEIFDSSRLSKAPSQFDFEKLKWFSKHYISQMSIEELQEKLKINADKNWSAIFIETFQKSAITFQDFYKNLDFFTNPIQKIPYEIEQLLITFGNELLIDYVAKNLDFQKWDRNQILETIKVAGEKFGLKGKNLLLPIRLATTWSQQGPDLSTAIWLLGSKVVSQRLAKWL